MLRDTTERSLNDNINARNEVWQERDELRKLHVQVQSEREKALIQRCGELQAERFTAVYECEVCGLNTLKVKVKP